jgi:hypothetical protein
MEFDSDHVDSKHAAIAGVVDPVATYSEASSIGVVLLWHTRPYMTFLIQSTGTLSHHMKTMVSVPLLTPSIP